jgi:uncharacterized protein (DUF433 family)
VADAALRTPCRTMRDRQRRRKGGDVAYATKMAAALSGATISQLRHWRSARTGPLLAPEIAAIGNLRNIGEVSHLASCRLVTDRGGTIQLLTATEAVDLGKNPGQLQLVAVIGDVIEPFAARAGVLVPHLLRPRPCLAVDPETQGGTPVIAGTRVPHDTVAGLMRDGVSAEQIRDYYPSVTAAAAADALDFARYVDSYDPASRAA